MTTPHLQLVGRTPANTGALASGGEPPHDGGMEARVAKLEAGMEHALRELIELRQDVRELRENARVDFRLIFGAVITVALGLAALMAHGFHWL